MELKCGMCKNYMGFGDWNLCCRETYELCYADTLACDKFVPVTNKVENGCCGCVYEDADDTIDIISNCVCCSRMVNFAKNDYYKKK